MESILAAISGMIYIFHKIKKLKCYHYIKLDPNQLLIGHTRFYKPIIVDMLVTPHILISGLSNSGKSKCVYIMLKNLVNADIIIYNSFRKDYKGITARFINGNEELFKLIESLLESKITRNRPLYLVLEEMATITDKKLKEKIKELLCVARHYNIFIIGVIQIATKESCSFKDLFNTRISFRQIESSNYRVVLSVSPNEDEILNQGEFYIVADELQKGKTYLI